MQKKLANLEFLTDTVTKFMSFCDNLNNLSRNPPVRSRKPSVRQSRTKPMTPQQEKDEKLPQILPKMQQPRLCVAHRERGKSHDLQQSYQFRLSTNMDSITMTKNNSNVSFSSPNTNQRRNVEKLLAERDHELFREMRAYQKGGVNNTALDLFGDEYQAYFG